MSESVNGSKQSPEQIAKNNINGDASSPFPKKWRGLWEKELKYLGKQRLESQKLLKEEIEQEMKFLLQWAPPLSEEELERDYSQSEIGNALKYFQKKQETLKFDIVKKEDVKKEIEKEIAELRKGVTQKQEKLIKFIENKNTVLKEIQILKEKENVLILNINRAVGIEKDLLKGELEQTIAELKTRESATKDDGLWDQLITETMKAWFSEQEKLYKLSIGNNKDNENEGEKKKSLEDITIEIEKDKKELEYNKLHQYHLMVEKLSGSKD